MSKQEELAARIQKVKTPAVASYDDEKPNPEKVREWLRLSGRLARDYAEIRALLGPDVDATTTLGLEFLAESLWHLDE